MYPKIKNIKARQIIDSRAVPTIETDIELEDGSMGRAAVPSGASTGETEAKELRDEDLKNYNGKGVSLAIEYTEGKIKDSIVNKSFTQKELDEKLIEIDGTTNKSHLGANTILALSLSYSVSLANHKKIPLYLHLKEEFAESKSMPKPMFNILNGGVHADSGLSFQEFMIVPSKETFSGSLKCGVEIYQSLKKLLNKKGLKTSVGDEGGFAPTLEKNEEALELIIEASENIGYIAGEDYELALDIAANEISKEEKYLYNGEYLEKSVFISKIKDLTDKYPMISIEDPLNEKDKEGFININQLIGDKVTIVGDDFLVTDPEKIEKSGQEKSTKGVIIKPNQIGTLTETLTAIKTAFYSGISPIVSHRSGETEDVSISHIAVAANVPMIKFGAPARGERTAKYNELLRIEEELFRR